MEVTKSKRMGSMMFMAALLLSLSIGANAKISKACKLKCGLFCSLEPEPFQCNLECLKLCPREPLTPLASKHCDIGCFLSTCLDYHSDAKKGKVDVKKVGACADSCSQGCQRSYQLH